MCFGHACAHSLSLYITITPSPSHQGHLVHGNLADQSGQLYLFDELISVNGQDVPRMDHSDVVTLIKASGTTITLEVQQPQGMRVCVCTCVCGFVLVCGGMWLSFFWGIMYMCMCVVIWILLPSDVPNHITSLIPLWFVGGGDGMGRR